MDWTFGTQRRLPHPVMGDAIPPPRSLSDKTESHEQDLLGAFARNLAEDKGDWRWRIPARHRSVEEDRLEAQEPNSEPSSKPSKEGYLSEDTCGDALSAADPINPSVPGILGRCKGLELELSLQGTTLAVEDPREFLRMKKLQEVATVENGDLQDVANLEKSNLLRATAAKGSGAIVNRVLGRRIRRTPRATGIAVWRESAGLNLALHGPHSPGRSSREADDSLKQKRLRAHDEDTSSAPAATEEQRGDGGFKRPKDHARPTLPHLPDLNDAITD